MSSRIKCSITARMVAAAAAASADGVGMGVISAVMRCGRDALQSRMAAAGHPRTYAGRRLSTAENRCATALHKPRLIAAAFYDAPVERPVAPRRSVDPLGLRAYTRPDGISVPYVPSIHDEVRA